MRFFYGVVMITLLFLLGISSYLFWQGAGLNLTSFFDRSSNLGAFEANMTFPVNNELQFYPDMRYRDKNISYWIEPVCNIEKYDEVESAFGILSEKTVLSFYSTNNNSAEISIFCSELTPEPEEKGHFVAGEGGPSRIVNMSSFSVILTGRIALFRDDGCDRPQVAIHEILHALGFNHMRDKKSIMYPVTSCNQEIDDSIIEEINLLYETPSRPDLLIESVNANRTGKYLNFKIIVSNYGLDNIGGVSLKVFSGEDEIKTFTLGGLSIGVSKVFSVENLRVSSGLDSVSFSVSGDKDELSLSNNVVNLILGEK